MDLSLDYNVATGYHSNSQIARVISEKWIEDNMYCPRCGNRQLVHFPNNVPVADFYCPVCKAEYELKSKRGRLSNKISDGAYRTMLDRISGNNNPDLLIMIYSSDKKRVNDLILIPKNFFTPQIIEKRKPLPATARRAGWVGCNIVIKDIPKQGRIAVVSDGAEEIKSNVLNSTVNGARLDIKNIAERGWIMDVLNCVNDIGKYDFTLQDVYAYENRLQSMHPENKNVKAKIRQQLQILRDNGYVAFKGKGNYSKLI